MATTLSIIQQAAGELGLPVPTAVAGTSDATAIQLLALLNREGKAQVDETDWPALVTEGTWTMVEGQSVYTYPSDFRRLVQQSEWDRTNKWALLGPDTPQVRQWRNESNISQAGPRKVFQLTSGGVEIWPTPTSSGAVLVYLYIKNTWATTAGGTAIASLTADTDIPILDENVLTLGTMWRFLSAKGLDATVVKGEYDRALSQAKTREIGGRRLDQSPITTEQFIGFNNIPDAGYGS